MQAKQIPPIQLQNKHQTTCTQASPGAKLVSTSILRAHRVERKCFQQLIRFLLDLVLWSLNAMFVWSSAHSDDRPGGQDDRVKHGWRWFPASANQVQPKKRSPEPNLENQRVFVGELPGKTLESPGLLHQRPKRAMELVHWLERSPKNLHVHHITSIYIYIHIWHIYIYIFNTSIQYYIYTNIYILTHLDPIHAGKRLNGYQLACAVLDFRCRPETSQHCTAAVADHETAAARGETDVPPTGRVSKQIAHTLWQASQTPKNTWRQNIWQSEGGS